MTDSILSAPREWLESSPTRWYLVFDHALRRCWWDILFRTRPGFEHVYALRWDGFNWLFFNPDAAFTDVAIVPGRSENALQSLTDPGATIVEVEAFRKVGQIRGRWWVGPMTCVEQIKALIGLSERHIWTPWQLYRYLMENCPHGDFQETQSAARDCAGKRAGTPPTIRARRVATRRK